MRIFIFLSCIFFFCNSTVIAQDSTAYVLPNWNIKILPLAFLNPVNPTLEIAVAKRISPDVLLQGSFGYIDHFYNETHVNKGYRTALDMQVLTGGIDEDGIGFFLGTQIMYRNLSTPDYEVIVSRFNGAYQQLISYRKVQHSCYLHGTFGGYVFMDKHFFFNWKVALGGRAYRESNVTKIPEDSSLTENVRRFGILDESGVDWTLLPSLRLSFNLGFGW